jgi:hypothetical protein
MEKTLIFADDEPLNGEAAFVGWYESVEMGGGRDLETAR